MKRVVWLVFCVGLSGCSLLQRPFRPVRAPPEEAAKVTFPFALSEEEKQGLIRVPGPVAAAIELAMDDFRPRDVKPHRGATIDEVCMYQRESFDVTTIPGPEGILFVRFTLSPGACEQEGAINDAGATYAVDTQGWRILAVQQ
ncbi:MULTISPECIES: hypothetical protein [Myxococcus]|uniref:hypothetical protein n=1 Tax=Myxococcus TaxID=32 RepID=UPI0013D3F9F5|nr:MULTISPECIES: hypothetical protein [Myxococcus]NOK04272.1 hypothetical protein [Myxococcus xanthus]